MVLKQYYISHYGGLASELPAIRPYGDTYFANDTGQLWKYDYDKFPRLINGPSDGIVPITQAAQNYSALTAGVSIGDIAYCNTSEGTTWLPGTLGGTYYPAGFYVWDGVEWVSDRNAIVNQLELNTLRKRVNVNQDNFATALSIIDPSKEYFIDGVVDIGNTVIEVPAGGINLKGYDFNISKLISSVDAYTMFTSPIGGSGDILKQDLAFEVSGIGSQLYDLVSATGNEAYEITRINFNNCTSRGEINNYRQGLETGTGYFGGTPELTLSGVWSGGFFIDNSIARGLSDGAYTLFKAGVGLTFGSRFRSNQNIDLPSLVTYIDFSASNFLNPSTFQLTNCIVTRGGVGNAEDTNLIPNLTPGNLVSEWTGNNGLLNTFVGGNTRIVTEATTTIAVAGTFVDLAGTFTTQDLQHFDEFENGKLRHLGESPREYSIAGQYVLDGAANDEVDLKVVIFRNATTTFEDSMIVRRVINNLQGGRNVAYFAVLDSVIMNQGDYLKLQVANVNGTGDITAELDSIHYISKR